MNPVETKKKRFMGHPANLLTCLRIALSLVLLFVPPLGGWFLLVYSLCGVTDMLDGPVARRTRSAGPTGARLDSLADLVFMAAALLTLLPVLWPLLPRWCLVWAGGVALVKLAAYAVGGIRFRRPAALHTVLNKCAGGSLFCVPYVYLLGGIRLTAILCCALTAAAAMEELLCMLKMDRYDPDIKSCLPLLPGNRRKGRAS